MLRVLCCVMRPMLCCAVCRCVRSGCRAVCLVCCVCCVVCYVQCCAAPCAAACGLNVVWCVACRAKSQDQACCPWDYACLHALCISHRQKAPLQSKVSEPTRTLQQRDRQSAAEKEPRRSSGTWVRFASNIVHLSPVRGGSRHLRTEPNKTMWCVCCVLCCVLCPMSCCAVCRCVRSECGV